MGHVGNATIGGILTSDEVASLLRVHVKLVRELALSRQIPCQRVGRAYRFSRQAILLWLEQRGTGHAIRQG